jgi:hypothetical protein
MRRGRVPADPQAWQIIGKQREANRTNKDLTARRTYLGQERNIREAKDSRWAI